MDVISEFISREVPWDMLYADELIVAEESSAKKSSRKDLGCGKKL